LFDDVVICPQLWQARVQGVLAFVFGRFVAGRFVPELSFLF